MDDLLRHFALESELKVLHSLNAVYTQRMLR